MSHNKIVVNSQSTDSSSDITLTVQNVVSDTASTNETIVGNASNEYEFGAAPSTLNPLTEYFFVTNTNTGGSQSVTGYGYVGQYVDNRSGTLYENSLTIQSTSQGVDGVNYGGVSSRSHAQLLVDEGTYFVEFYPAPKWSGSGYSVLQLVQGNAGTADVKGNRSYCYTNVPSRNFYARVKSTGTNQRVGPEILSNTNQTIGSKYSTSQAFIAYKI